MTTLNFTESQLVSFFFVLTRVTSLVFFLPIFGDRAIPPTVKILFGVAFAGVLYPVLLAAGAAVPPEVLSTGWKTIWALCCELGFGMMVAFVARWIFDAVQFGGHFAGMSIGFSMASVFDPHSETQTIALAEAQYIMAALLFLAMDGHHVYLQAILKSFQIVPLGGADLLAHGDAVAQFLIKLTANVLVLGLKLAAPVLVVALIVNLTFGVLTRAVPQMNVMTVSFTANIVLGLFVAFVSLPGFVNMTNGAFDSYAPDLMKFMRLFSG